MLGGHATRIFYMCIAAPRVAFYADSVGAAYTKCAVHLCEMCCRLRAPSAGWPVHLAWHHVRVFYVTCHACAAGLPPAPLPRRPPAARGPRPVEAVRPYRRHGRRDRRRRSHARGRRQRITLNVPRPATGAVLTVESERPVTYTLYRARHDERAVRRERAPGDV